MTFRKALNELEICANAVNRKNRLCRVEAAHLH